MEPNFDILGIRLNNQLLQIRQKQKTDRMRTPLYQFVTGTNENSIAESNS